MSNKVAPLPPWIIQNFTLTEKQTETLLGTSVMIGTPMYGGMCVGTYTIALLDFQKFATQIGLKVAFNVLYNESLVQRGRNAIMHGFMKSDIDYLMFIDADIGFNPFAIFELLLAAEHNKLDIIGGSYSKKSINWQSVEKAMQSNVDPKYYIHCAGNHVIIPAANENANVPIYHPFEVKYLGTGFQLTHRRAFEKFKLANPEQWYKNNHIPNYPSGEPVWAYFDCIIDKEPDRVYLSEDYYFCNKLRAMGEKIWLAPWVYLTHMGSFLYEGCFFCSHQGYIHDIKRKEPPQ
jgi:glycosyltransferase involved in cell wall biosynthesis